MPYALRAMTFPRARRRTVPPPTLRASTRLSLELLPASTRLSSQRLPVPAPLSGCPRTRRPHQMQVRQQAGSMARASSLMPEVPFSPWLLRSRVKVRDLGALATGESGVLSIKGVFSGLEAAADSGNSADTARGLGDAALSGLQLVPGPIGYAALAGSALSHVPVGHDRYGDLTTAPDLLADAVVGTPDLPRNGTIYAHEDISDFSEVDLYNLLGSSTQL
jgi:hypothetical protein